MAGVRVTIEVQGLDRVSRTLRRLSEAGQDLRPIFADIGEHLVNSHQERWHLERSPDGEPWQPLSPEYAARKRRARPNAGILIYDDLLRGQLAYVVSGDALLVGTNRPYGAVHQFGHDYSTGAVLPARPWLGLSDDDEAAVLEIVRDYLTSTIE